MKEFINKMAKNSFYIVVFLCVAAIGISGYVMFVADRAEDSVKAEIENETSLELPFPEPDDESLYDIGETDIPEPEPVPIEPPRESVSVMKEEHKQEEPKKKEEKRVTSVEPVINMPEETEYTMAVNGAITAPFSGEELVKSKTMGDWRIHCGVDIKGNLGDEVKTISRGTVKTVENDSMMGNTVTIEHEGGLVSIYANLSDDIKVKRGERVENGSVIGKIGNSALCECLEEPHLHLEVHKNGKPIDPLSLFPAGED